MSVIRPLDLVRVSRRLMVLQSSWCEGSMQAEGLAYGISPGLRRIYEDPEDLAQAIRRYHITFNTHPFLTGVVAGAILKMEQAGEDPKKIDLFINTTMGPLAAFGDPFFKGALSPFVGVLSVVSALCLGPAAGIFALLVIFNAVHLFVRFKGILVGFRAGDQALLMVAKWIGPTRTTIIKTATAVLAGSFFVLVALRFDNTINTWEVSLTGALGLLCALLLIKKRSLSVYMAPALILVILLLEVFV